MRTLIRVVIAVTWGSLFMAGQPALAKNEFTSAQFAGMLTKEEDKNLTKQARLGVASANTIKRFLTPEQFPGCRSWFNSYATWSNFPLTKEEGIQYAQEVTQLLQTSKKVAYLDAPQNDSNACGILIGFSVVTESKKEKLYELVVYVFDWQRARASGKNGSEAIIAGGILSLTSRKLVESSTKPSKQELAADSFSTYKSMLERGLQSLAIR